MWEIGPQVGGIVVYIHLLHLLKPHVDDRHKDFDAARETRRARGVGISSWPYPILNFSLSIAFDERSLSSTIKIVIGVQCPKGDIAPIVSPY